MITANSMFKIEQTNPQMIFEPLEKLVTQLTYANMKINLDLKH